MREILECSEWDASCVVLFCHVLIYTKAINIYYLSETSIYIQEDARLKQSMKIKTKQKVPPEAQNL